MKRTDRERLPIARDYCLDSSEYITMLNNNVEIDIQDFPLEELPDVLKKFVDGYDEVEPLWDYLLTDIGHIVENNISTVLVRFPSNPGEYTYRLCEIADEEEEYE